MFRLWRLSYSEFRNRPLRVLLTLMSIVIGSAAVVAVNLTSTTVRQAQNAMFESVSGKAHLEIASESNAGFEGDVVDLVRAQPGIQAAVPSLYRSTVMFFGDLRVRTQVMGIDPSSDEVLRPKIVTQGRMFEKDFELIVDEQTARSLSMKLGDEIKLLAAAGLKEWKVVCFYKLKGASSLAQGGIVFAPLDAVQSRFRTRGRIDKIELMVQNPAELDKAKTSLSAMLPTGLYVQSPKQDNQIAEQARNATEQALRLATTFALIIAVFIIYNTFQMAVGERRRQLGILRAMGATRRQITEFILHEAFFLGVIGSLVGIAIGVVGAHFLTQATSQVIQTDLPAPRLSWQPFVVAALFGIGIALVGAFVPARRAGLLSPAEAMQLMTAREIESSRGKSLYVGLAITALGIGFHLGCMMGWLSMKWSIPGSVALLFGSVFLLPRLLLPVSRVTQWVLAPFLGIEAKLAHRQLMRHRSRTALTTSVLFIALSTGIGLAWTIMDNIRDVDLWCSKAIVGDYFVRAAMPDLASGKAASLPAEFDQKLRDLDGIDSLDSLRFVSARTGEHSVIVVIREFRDADQVYFDVSEGDAKTLAHRVQDGSIVVGSVLAERLKLHVDDALQLDTMEGKKDLRIAGIVNDYIAGGLTVYLQRGFGEKLFHVEGQDAYIIRVDPAKRANVEAKLKALSDENGLLLQSNAELVEMIRSLSNGVNGGLWGLLALGAIIAAFGLINTLTMNILEQTREIGLLRVVAMTRHQIRRMIFAQALLLGLTGFVPGACMGIFTAYLINLSTYTAIGHEIEFGMRPWLAFGSLGLALITAMTASWLPAERATRIALTQALRYE